MKSYCASFAIVYLIHAKFGKKETSPTGNLRDHAIHRILTVSRESRRYASGCYTSKGSTCYSYKKSR